MKKRGWFFVLPALLVTLMIQSFSSAHAEEAVKELRVLSIGNSFSFCLENYFVKVVESVPGCKVEWDHLTIGGCSLEKHWSNIAKEEAEPGYKYFKKYTYKEKIQSKKWDIVSIQQAGRFSVNYETFMPYLRHLNDFIKANAPQAEVVIQQTWSYRPDEKRMTQRGLNQNSMYDKLAEAYNNAGKEINARIIPVGFALQLARKNQPGGYQGYNPEDYKAPALPDISRYFIGVFQWNKDKTEIEGDAYHLNNRGEYLQACVWFAILFDRPATDVTFVPKEITEADAKFIRETAQKATVEFKQVKK